MPDVSNIGLESVYAVNIKCKTHIDGSDENWDDVLCFISKESVVGG